MTKKYYKVFSINHQGIKESMLVYNSDFVVQYQYGEWVYPKALGTKLFVFDNLGSAKDFMRCRNIQYPFRYGSRICEVEVKNPSSIKRYKLFYWCYGFSSNIIKQMLLLRKKRKKFTHLGTKPTLVKNNVVVDAVKLIKEVG